MKLSRVTLLAAASAIALAGCTATDVQTNDPNQRTKEGVATGALLGGLVGVISGDDGGERRRGAVIGAIAGGALGGVIGNNLDQQAAELQQELGNDRIQIINNGDHLLVRMPDDILFAVDSAEVNGALRSDLVALASNLNRYPDSTVQVVGHTDNSGGAAYNQDLSERRAAAVSSVLIGAGVLAGRIDSFGLGEDQPIATNLTEEGKALNRRVDITIRPNA